MEVTRSIQFKRKVDKGIKCRHQLTELNNGPFNDCDHPGGRGQHLLMKHNRYTLVTVKRASLSGTCTEPRDEQSRVFSHRMR
jgi:hypothetical protein